MGKKVFVPGHYRFSERRQLLETIEAKPFAQLISLCRSDLRVTATPLIREAGGDTLNFIGHIARRNPHCAAIERGEKVLALFSGPDAYISPRWFSENPGVPTWSYISIQLRGHFRAITDVDETRLILHRSIEHMERLVHPRGDSRPWSLEEAPADLVRKLSRGILAFRLEGESIEGVRRLNQDKEVLDKYSIMAGLAASTQRGAEEILGLMAEQLHAAAHR